jgi:hypothetical protein
MTRADQQHRRSIPVLYLSICLLVLVTARGWGQVDQGAITGVVQDATGAVIPNAQVTLTDTDTNLELQDTTSSSGTYVFSPIKIGHYKVSATAPGFSTTSQENLQVDVQARLNIVLVLKPGATVTQVTVSTAPPLMQTEQASVGQVLTTTAINNTALNGRNWVYIAQLAAGVAPSLGLSRGSSTGDFFANGQRATQNDFIMDGVDNNINNIDFMNGSSYAVRPPPDALSEFKVDTSNFSAEFGHSAGAVLNASIKSGTNNIHGSVWEYLRNTDLDARDWDALTVPKYIENQFGATLGFPLLRNRLFYFGDVEANRIIFGLTTVQTVPTALMRQGNFSELLNTKLTGSAQPIQLYQPNSESSGSPLQCNGQNNVFCASQINPTALKVLNLYPAPSPGNSQTNNNNTVTLNNASYTWQWDQRLDWNINPRDQTFARYSYLHVQAYTPSSLGQILGNANAAYAIVLSENVAVSETHIFNPSLTNEIRFGYNWGRFDNLQENYFNPNLAASVGFGGVPSGPSFPDNGGVPVGNISNLALFGDNASTPSLEGQNVYQILDNLTKIAGKHSLKFGLTLQSVRMSFLQPSHSRGDYTYTGLYTSLLNKSFTGYSVADFLADQMNSASLSNESRVNDVRWYRSGYFQDDWKILPKLALNLGLRYDYYQPNKENSGRQSNFVNLTGGVGTGTGLYQIPEQASGVPISAAFQSVLAANNVTLQYVANPHLVNAQMGNFAPRIGFAYQLTPLWVVRGGWGLFYGGLESFGGRNLGATYPFAFTGTLSAPSCALGNCPNVGISVETGFAQQIAQGLQNFVSNPTLQSLPPTIHTAYTMNYNFTVERALSNSLVATAGYVANASRHLETGINPNGPYALVNPVNSTLQTEPFPGLGQQDLDEFAGVSNYSSLQTKLQKRYSNGLDFLATYTYGHALDNTATPLSTTTPRNANLIPISNEYTNSLWDIRHRFTFNGFYALPFGKERAHTLQYAWERALAGGWASSLTFAAQTGNPFPQVTPNITAVTPGGLGIVRTTMVRNPFKAGGTPDPSNPSVTCAATTRNRINWYNPCAFANPLSGTLISPGNGAGNSPYVPQAGYAYPKYVTGQANAMAFLGGRGSTVYGPGYERINMSVFKDFTAWREEYLQFRVDIFNVFNHPSWNTPSIVTDNTNGGQITAPKAFQANTPDSRFFQISAKYVF